MSSSAFFATHPVFTHDEYLASRAERADRSPRTAENLLARHVAAGNIVRIRRKLYAAVRPGADPKKFQPNPYLVATKLAPDAVVAYHAALQFRGNAYSIWPSYSVLTRTKAARLSFRSSDWVPVRVPWPLAGLPDLGGGIDNEPYDGGTVRVTSNERTLVDALDAPELCGGWEEVWRCLEMIDSLDMPSVLEHTLKRRAALLAGRVGYFLEQHRDALRVEEEHLKILREHAPRQATYLDRSREPGKLVKPWNLIVPDSVANKTWEEPWVGQVLA